MNAISNRLLVLWRSTPCVVSMCMLALFATACSKGKFPCRYLIPQEYVGWVLIQRSVMDAPLPRREAGYLIFEIPRSGRLAFAGEPESGWARDEYYYVDEKGSLKELSRTTSGGGGLIWGEGVGSYLQNGHPELKYEHFFVGPEEQFRRAPSFDEVVKTLASERSPS